tara:strand:- start:905 stop:1123 length:219 start_codon:yes stop_codon:yes gene_type:complete
MESEKQKLLQQLLIDCMLEDLKDPDKCTPGLYQVVRGVLNDSKGDIDSIPTETMDFLESRLSDAIPFKKETG